VAEPAEFDDWYRDDPDPFGVRTRWYERRKRAVLLASLRLERYRCAWDPACGTGDLALALADRCALVVGSDVAPRAVALSRALTAGRPNVRIERNALPDVVGIPLVGSARPSAGEESTDGFDLLVLAEVQYYLPAAARAATVAALDSAMRAPGPVELVSVHWRHHPHDGFLSGVDVTAELDAQLRGRGWASAVRHDDAEFVLASWTRDTAERAAGGASWT